jgi:hypothetical protein
MIDKEFSQFLINLHNIIESYVQWENILHEKEQEIASARKYIYENKNYLAWLWFENYTTIMEFLADSWKYKDELFILLGKDTPQNYLIILQNSNEKRPNGWFFWSFAFVQVYQWRIQHLEIIDSYLPDFIGYKVWLEPPIWSQTFLPEKRVAFVAANWFGFTPIDGSNIKKLYEDVFGWNYDQERVSSMIDSDIFSLLVDKHIKWVIFIETKLLESIMPSITQKLRERQFVNAAIDIIRWESRSNKKEIYIAEVNKFFKENTLTISKHIINNFSNVIDQRSINIFLSNVSDQFYGLIQKRHLSNNYNSNHIYARDINDSYNKIDGFIQKNIQIVDDNGRIVSESDSDIIAIDELNNGRYTMFISYNLTIPNFYRDVIKSFEKKYDIELGNREKIILWLMPNVWITPEWWLRYRTRSVVYFPMYVTIPHWQDIGFRSEFFTAPFARGWYYNMRIRDGETRKTVSIDFTIDK